MKVDPKRLRTEANVVYRLCRALDFRRITFSLEYRLTAKELGAHRGARLDVVIIRGDEIVAIIEAKRVGRKRNLGSGQLIRYRRAGVPVFAMFGESQVDAAAWFAADCVFGRDPYERLRANRTTAKPAPEPATPLNRHSSRGWKSLLKQGTTQHR